MPGLAQFGIAVGALGGVLTVMGLFPSITGIRTGVGVGIVQIMTILTGFALLIFGGLIYVKFTFYANRPANLSQQIGVRLSLTGLVLAGMAGLADFLGFGSHVPVAAQPFFGFWQTTAIVIGFFIASLGVLIYAVTGAPPHDEQRGAGSGF
jgi:hypothetical protein